MILAEPVISVVMSVYNGGAYLASAVESILKQTFEDFEFIIINDGSTDDTLEVIRRYAQIDRRIIVIEKDNTGLADSLNAGIRTARARWIARLDSDDVALPDRLGRQLTFLREHPSVLLLGTGCILRDQSGRHVRKYVYPPGHDSLVHHMEVGGPMFPHSSALFLKEPVLQLGGYNIRFLRAQDKDLWLRISEMGHIACLRKPLVGLRKHSGQVSYHDGIETQTVLDFSAMVCHFLRSDGAADPSLLDADTWDRFVTWITHRLELKGVLQVLRDWVSLRQQWYAADCGGIAHSVRLALGVLKSQKGLRIVTQRLFGTKLPKKLAREWKSTA